MRKILSAAVAMAMAAAAVVATQSPASAAWGNCSSSDLSGVTLVGCLYWHTNGEGPIYYVNTIQGCRNLPGSWNDAVSSVANNAGSNYRLVLWANGNCSGSSKSWSPGVRSNVGGLLSPLGNDQASSWAVYRI